VSFNPLRRAVFARAVAPHLSRLIGLLSSHARIGILSAAKSGGKERSATDAAPASTEFKEPLQDISNALRT
jgi:hypothetical protein